MRNKFLIVFLCLAFLVAGCSKKEAEDSVATQAKPDKTETQQADNTSEPRRDLAAKKPPAKPPASSNLSPEQARRLEQTIASSFGKGTFKNKDGNTFSFTFEGSVLEDESGYGTFRLYSFQGKDKLDIKGSMSCVNVDSANRRIWLGGKIEQNNSNAAQYRDGMYAEGNFLQFRARPNKMDGSDVVPGAIEMPSFGDEAALEEFCEEKSWSEAGLIELGPNDLIASIP